MCIKTKGNKRHQLLPLPEPIHHINQAMKYFAKIGKVMSPTKLIKLLERS